MSEIETIEIVNDNAPSGFTRINLCDFDPKVHKPFGESRPDPVTHEGALSTDEPQKRKYTKRNAGAE